jgi:hypothetical protein
LCIRGAMAQSTKFCIKSSDSFQRRKKSGFIVTIPGIPSFHDVFRPLLAEGLECLRPFSFQLRISETFRLLLFKVFTGLRNVWILACIMTSDTHNMTCMLLATRISRLRRALAFHFG